MKRFTLCILVLTATAMVSSAWAGKDKEEPQLRLELDLVDGSRIIGVPSLESVPVQTSYAKMDVALKQIQSINIAEDHENASIDLRNGDKLKGVVTLEPIKMETAFGKVKIGVEHIRTVSVVLQGGALPDQLQQGLVLCYSFDRDEGRNVTDGSGRKNAGGVRGAKWEAVGKRGGAYAFDGAGDYIAAAGLTSLDNNNFSGTAWINVTGSDSVERGIFGKANAHGTQYGWIFRVAASSSTLTFVAWGPDGFIQQSASGFALVHNRFYHVGFTYASGLLTIYLDGVPVLSTKVGQVSASGNAMTVGRTYQDYDGEYFTGMIDEVMIFNRALSDSEVKQIYDTQK